MSEGERPAEFRNLSPQAEQMISTSAYGTKWYITLFANSVPFATQLRLWDGFLLEGFDFLVVTAVAIIWHFQREHLSSPSSLLPCP